MKKIKISFGLGVGLLVFASLIGTSAIARIIDPAQGNAVVPHSQIKTNVSGDTATNSLGTSSRKQIILADWDGHDRDEGRQWHHQGYYPRWSPPPVYYYRVGYSSGTIVGPCACSTNLYGATFVWGTCASGVAVWASCNGSCDPAFQPGMAVCE